VLSTRKISGFLLLGLLLDQLTKYFFNTMLTLYTPVTVIPGALQFQLVYNSGAAYGLFANQRFMLLMVSLSVIFGIVIFWNYLSDSLKVAFLWIFSGAVGNFLDRFILGFVIDFIDIHIIPVFNFADIFINIGIILYIKSVLQDEFFESKKSR
jgi:signal peptidase II